jgi:cold shock CspA family protein/ribosome-associated translation inhibitor RaiA
MQIPVEISFRDMDRSEALAADIQAKANKLGKLFDGITRCWVVIQAPHPRDLQGNLYRVRIQLSVPLRDLIADYESQDNRQHEDPSIAVHDAFDSIRHRLKEYVKEQRSDKKPHGNAPHGRISKICLPEGKDHPEHGYGYISTCDGRDVYFHANSVVNVEFSQLEMGSEVHFVEEPGDDGPQAVSVRLVGKQQHLDE